MNMDRNYVGNMVLSPKQALFPSSMVPFEYVLFIDHCTKGQQMLHENAMRLIYSFQYYCLIFITTALKPIKDELSDYHYVRLLSLDCAIYSMEIQKSHQIIKTCITK